MPKYEILYVEIRYRDEKREWMTSSEQKSIPFDSPSDEDAGPVAKILLKAPSDDPLVWMKVPVKLVRVIDLEPTSSRVQTVHPSEDPLVRKLRDSGSWEPVDETDQ